MIKNIDNVYEELASLKVRLSALEKPAEKPAKIPKAEIKKPKE